MQENGEEDDPEEMEPVPSLPTSSIRTVSPEMSEIFSTQQSSPFIPPSSALSTSSSPFLYHPPQTSSPYPPYVEVYLSAQGSSFGSGRSSPTLASTQSSTPGYEYTEMADLRVHSFTASSPMHRTNLRSEEVDITNELFGTKDQDQNWKRTGDGAEDWTRIEDELESQEEDQEERARKISDLKEIGAQLPDLNSFLAMVGSLIKN
ncbi:uncharacterized protein LOC111704193 [Eurytemora carolleeae]|uniref:uncharacterized protein LOC111704193 n=1 Tax=Eurytemora carolleeae TaxID=1294199 RepID=UPI000C759C1C|nr:uncharacterized protein LOC111704193 [Eurytemora carolleeae]|eukprot:XP_023332115.1 uncharacterized protein LOC111704193 [Eurytemora affinis]